MVKYEIIAAGCLLLLVTSFVPVNSCTLHAFYRERLAEAFLFDIRWVWAAMQPQADLIAAWGKLRSWGHTPDDSALKPLRGPLPPTPQIEASAAANGDYIKLTQLDEERAPYLLINTTLNIQGSRLVNKRGRNADFFVLSRNWVGSASTGYAPTQAFERKSRDFDLATAVAVSGAAASSNMGSLTIRALAPTLALLNVRLGYWARNPRYVLPAMERMPPYARPPRGLRRLIERNYLLCEMFSIISEDSARVYLTDGGHLENLGVYELLRRRCRFIICVDAECDAGMNFGALEILQRYSRIDLGVRIEGLDWPQIRKSALDIDNALSAGKSYSGPHVALGRIKYPNAPDGWLLYVKSSLSGDEGDIILDYHRQYADFPHETTGDQFFSEKQFEAYRALGFHIMFRALSGEDAVPGLVTGLNLDGSPPDEVTPAMARRARRAGIDELFAGA